MFTVTWVKDEISYEFGNAPCRTPCFTNNGRLPPGTTNVQSAGCVRMNGEAARTFFNLQPGDKVYIY